MVNITADYNEIDTSLPPVNETRKHSSANEMMRIGKKEMKRLEAINKKVSYSKASEELGMGRTYIKNAISRGRINREMYEKLNKKYGRNRKMTIVSPTVSLNMDKLCDDLKNNGNTLTDVSLECGRSHGYMSASKTWGKISIHTANQIEEKYGLKMNKYIVRNKTVNTRVPDPAENGINSEQLEKALVTAMTNIVAKGTANLLKAAIKDLGD